MKKILLSGLVVFAFIGYALFQKFGDDDDVQVTAPTQAALTAQTSTTTASYKDGTYTGDIADAYYGNIQVQATISGGKITDVTFLQYPNDRDDSVRINTRAMPYLKQEAIAAQSSTVDTVSGATQTSEAFRESLKSALSKAS